MTTFTQHTIETAPEGSKAGLERTIKAFGFVPNLASFMAESPALLNSYNAVWDIFASQTTLSPIEQQVVLLTVNYENNCHYCMAGHSTLAKKVNMDAATLTALREGTRIPNAKLQALREFTRLVVVERGFVPEAAVDAFLKAGYTRANVFEVIAGVGLKVMSNYTNHITHTPLDPFMVANTWTHPTQRGAGNESRAEEVPAGL